MIPGISFGNMHSGSDIANAYMQDRALREQAIRELGNNVSNSINLGFNRRNEREMQEKQLAQAALESQQNRDLQEKLAVMNNDLAKSQLGLNRELGFGNLGLDERRLNQSASQFDASNALANKQFDFTKELGLRNLGLDERKLEQSGSQFDKQLKFEQDKFDYGMGHDVLDDWFKSRSVGADEKRAEAELLRSKSSGLTPEDLYKFTLHANQSAEEGKPIDPALAPNSSIGSSITQGNSVAATKWLQDFLQKTLDEDHEISPSNLINVRSSPLYNYLPAPVKSMIDNSILNQHTLMIDPTGKLRPFSTNMFFNKEVPGGINSPLNLPTTTNKESIREYGPTRGLGTLTKNIIDTMFKLPFSIDSGISGAQQSGR